MSKKIKDNKSRIKVQKLPLTKSNVEKYQNTPGGGYLNHFRTGNDARGYLLIGEGKLVGAVCVDRGSDGNFWVQALEVSKEYQGRGYGKQLLDLAKSLNATNLSVRKTNKEALHLYLSNGFKAYRDTGYQYLMSTKNMGSELHVVDPYKKENQKEKEFKEAVMSSMGWKFTESVTMNGNDCVINLENFEQGLFNFILVIGLPGSGKGTFGRKLSDKYNAIHLELDIFDQCGNMTDEEIKKAGSPFREYILNTPEGQWYRKNAKTLSLNEKLQGNHDFIEYTISYCKSQRNNLFVIDGTPIYAAMQPEEICNYPIIIKGTTANDSFHNKVGRDMNTKSSDKKLHSKVTPEDLKGLLSYYWGDDQYLAKFKQLLIDDPNVSSVEGDVVDHNTPMVMTETYMKSTIDKDYTSKGHKRLTDFKRLVISPKSMPSKYKKQLKLRGFDKYDHGYLWVDEDDDVVALCTVSDRLSTGNYTWMKWISAVEVSKKYQGYGLSKQVLDVAVKTLHGNTLSVSEDNKIAHHLYKSYGFKEIPQKQKTKKTITMILESVESDYTESANSLYFFHMVDSESDMSHGLLSPEYMYQHGMEDMFLQSTEKYRDRMCGAWGIYPGRHPASLSVEEIRKGLKKFRGKYGTRYIYFFRFPPYQTLDKRFRELYKTKELYRIDLNDPGLQSIITDVFYGNRNSNGDNEALDLNYYQNINPEEYFGNFDPKSPMLFATLNHIGIATKTGTIPRRFLTKVSTPNTLSDITESCKDVATARKFVSEVGKLAKKYDANYFIVTDGASGTSNKGNPAVRHARECQIQWEKEHGFDPDEDWSKPNKLEDVLNESVLLSKDDIYYNKEKFDSGETNLCFITGLSGSGKTTLGKELTLPNKLDFYELDDVIRNWNFSMENLKEYGDVIYSFFNGVGAKYKTEKDDPEALTDRFGDQLSYIEIIIKDFISYTIQYAKSHPTQKIVVEGVWIYMFLDPRSLDDYAVYIKGTGRIKSLVRSIRRNLEWHKKQSHSLKELLQAWTFELPNIKHTFILENKYLKQLATFIDYFKNKL